MKLLFCLIPTLNDERASLSTPLWSIDAVPEGNYISFLLYQVNKILWTIKKKEKKNKITRKENVTGSYGFLQMNKILLYSIKRSPISFYFGGGGGLFFLNC